MADIFIGYASADREIARALGQAPSARGHDISCWTPALE